MPPLHRTIAAMLQHRVLYRPHPTTYCYHPNPNVNDSKNDNDINPHLLREALKNIIHNIRLNNSDLNFNSDEERDLTLNTRRMMKSYELNVNDIRGYTIINSKRRRRKRNV